MRLFQFTETASEEEIWIDPDKIRLIRASLSDNGGTIIEFGNGDRVEVTDDLNSVRNRLIHPGR